MVPAWVPVPFRVPVPLGVPIPLGVPALPPLPVRCAVGPGGLWGSCPRLDPGAARPGAPSYLHGKKEERFGVRWQEI